MQNLICAQLGRAPASDPCAVKSANLRSVAGSKVAAEQRLGPAGEQKFVYLLCSHCMAARLRSCELVSFRHEIGKLTQSLLNTEPSEHAAIVGSELREHEGTVPATCLGLGPVSSFSFFQCNYEAIIGIIGNIGDGGIFFCFTSFYPIYQRGLAT